MSDFTINVPIREADGEDVKNAFATAYGYTDTINAGNGVLVPNPITKEQFVQQCCINFMLNITKKINGGTIGLEDRMSHYNAYLQMM